MKTTETTLSEKRINRLRAQGYTSESKNELSRMAFGIRFAYRACVGVLTVALVTQSIVLYSVMLVIAILGFILPNHPFDYIYNHVLSGRMNRPKLPARSAQLKFACTQASAWLAAVIILMATGNALVGSIMAAVLIGVALLPSTTDYCVPSAFYNSLHQRKKARTQTQSI